MLAMLRSKLHVQEYEWGDYWVLCEQKIAQNFWYQENDSICEHYVGLYCENI